MLMDWVPFKGLKDCCILDGSLENYEIPSAIFKGWALCLQKAHYFDDQLEPGESLSGASHSAPPGWHPRPFLPLAQLPKSTINGWAGLKNGYPFDLPKVCHLVDIPITSKIKCVCLNIILMFTLGTKGQTADPDQLTVINSASNLVTFPVYSISISLCLPPQPLSAAQALLKLTIIQFRIDQWKCVVSKQND